MSDLVFNDYRNPSTKNNLDDIKLVDGLIYIPNFISLETHNQLLYCIGQETWSNELKRRVQHYGYKYNYKFRKIDKSMYIGGLPEWTNLIDLSQFMNPDQLIVNEYLSGQGISDHTDCEPCFKDTISSISLGSPIVMNFKHRLKQQINVLLEPRSLVILSGSSRYEWTHGIPARKSDIFKGEKLIRTTRVSLTFREVLI
jgi:alkylated DNA repair dioxygenase AlkB